MDSKGDYFIAVKGIVEMRIDKLSNNSVKCWKIRKFEGGKMQKQYKKKDILKASSSCFARKVFIQR